LQLLGKRIACHSFVGQAGRPLYKFIQSATT
jgi:hypothetical protein